jgi:hypothetical protein
MAPRYQSPQISGGSIKSVKKPTLESVGSVEKRLNVLRCSCSSFAGRLAALFVPRCVVAHHALATAQEWRTNYDVIINDAVYLHSQMYWVEASPIVAVQFLDCSTLLNNPLDFLNLTKPDNRLSDSWIRVTSSTVKPFCSKFVLMTVFAFAMSASLNLGLDVHATDASKKIPAQNGNDFITPPRQK